MSGSTFQVGVTYKTWLEFLVRMKPKNALLQRFLSVDLQETIKFFESFCLKDALCSM